MRRRSRKGRRTGSIDRELEIGGSGDPSICCSPVRPGPDMVPSGARSRGSPLMLHAGHMALESIKACAQCNTRVKLVPLSDSARKEGVVLIGVMFADRHVPMRVSTM